MNRTQTAHKKKAVLVALESSLGVITTACKSVKLNRRTFYEWLEKDETFAAAVAEMGEVALDFAESKLHGNIKAGKEASIIFYLKTKGKKRGYIERSELAIGDSAAFVIAPEQKGAMKILHSINERNDKTG